MHNRMLVQGVPLFILHLQHNPRSVIAPERRERLVSFFTATLSLCYVKMLRFVAYIYN